MVLVTPALACRCKCLIQNYLGSVCKFHCALFTSAPAAVLGGGDAAAVKDLIERYRAATGIVKPAGAGDAGKPAGKDKELSSEAKKAAAALAPVESKRSGVTAPSDPANFDDAWKQAASEV